ncbi:hypothetical protein [Streptomyces umbrinus]|uniref:hypothetical protein n=1 Tax=Streptomyces umbrinus TaxID=67370 RepID=UPI001BC8CF58|nr:hypothetical protein [Streptomyces umbrinus]
MSVPRMRHTSMRADWMSAGTEVWTLLTAGPAVSRSARNARVVEASSPAEVFR